MTKLRFLAATALVAVSAAVLPGCAGMVIGAGATAGTAAAQDRGIGGAIDLTILEGRVMLAGVVATDKARSEAARLAWRASGVKDVYNDIEVVPDGEAVIDKSTDAWIEERLNTKLLFDKNIESINYAVDVINGVIYIMGIARDQAELDRVVAYARDIANVQRVVTHVMLKTDPRRVSG